MDGIEIPPIEEFINQKQLHYQIRDGLQEMISDFEKHQQKIIENIDKDQIEHYYQWWQNLKASVLQQATLHDQLGQTLNDAGNQYYETDQQVAQSMKDTTSQS